MVHRPKHRMGLPGGSNKQYYSTEHEQRTCSFWSSMSRYSLHIKRGKAAHGGYSTTNCTSFREGIQTTRKHITLVCDFVFFILRLQNEGWYHTLQVIFNSVSKWEFYIGSKLKYGQNFFSFGTKLMHNDGFNQITRAVFNRVVVGFKQT